MKEFIEIFISLLTLLSTIYTIYSSIFRSKREIIFHNFFFIRIDVMILLSLILTLLFILQLVTFEKISFDSVELIIILHLLLLNIIHFIASLITFKKIEKVYIVYYFIVLLNSLAMGSIIFLFWLNEEVKNNIFSLIINNNIKIILVVLYFILILFLSYKTMKTIYLKSTTLKIDILLKTGSVETGIKLYKEKNNYVLEKNINNNNKREEVIFSIASVETIKLSLEKELKK